MKFSVFTKPWKTQSLDELGELVHNMGFNAVEYPLRDGFQVQPSDGAKGILNLRKTLAKFDVAVTSIASGIDVRVIDGKGEVIGATEGLFAACGEAQVPIVRICQSLNGSLGFHENMDALRKQYDALVPYCEKYGVTLGVQMHCGWADINNSYDSYILLKDYNPKAIAAVWDAGHAGLAGESPRYGLDCLWDNLCMVNFKAAYWQSREKLVNGEKRWDAVWVPGREGMGSWSEAVNYLKSRNYSGTVCLPAEYSDESQIEKDAAEDLKYIKELFGV